MTTTRHVSFLVQGRPRPQGSKRAMVNPRTGRAVMVEQSKHVGNWRQDVRAAAAATGEEMFSVHDAVRVVVTFMLKRPKGHTGKRGLLAAGRRKPYPTSVPDIDKLCRAVLDAITDVLIPDDSQVVSLWAQKAYASTDACHVTVEGLPSCSPE